MISPHFRQCLRRRAFRVRQAGQTIYMARAKRWVSSHAPPRIAAARARLSSVEVIQEQ